MKILYLHQYFTLPSTAGGTRSYEMARRLVAAGHEVHMITSDRERSGTQWVQSEEEGIHVHWLPVQYSNHMGNAQRMQAFLRFAWGAAQQAVAIGGELIFATSTPLTIALPAIFAGTRLKIPMVFEVRDLWPSVPIAMGVLKGRLAIQSAQQLERQAYRSAKHIVALSPDMAMGIASTGVSWDKISVIPNAANRALFDVSKQEGMKFRQRFSWLKDRPMVLYTGTMGRVNGVDYLVRLAKATLALDPEIRFVIVGAGGQEQQTRQLAAELGVLDRNLFFLDPVAKKDLPAILSATTVATSTVIDRKALWANSANKVFDCLAAGRPIVINHRGWLAELIESKGCGLVLSADNADIQMSAAQLAGKLRDAKWCERSGAAAAKVAEERFDQDHLASQLQQVLEVCHANAGEQSASGTRKPGDARLVRP